MWLRWQIYVLIHFVRWNSDYEWLIYNNNIHEDLPHNQFSCLRSKRKDLAGSKNESSVCSIMMTVLSHSLVFIDVSDGRECLVGECICVFVDIVSGRTGVVLHLLTLTAACPQIRESGWGRDDSHQAGGWSGSTKRKFGAMKVKLRCLNARPLCCHRCLNNKTLQIFAAQGPINRREFSADRPHLHHIFYVVKQTRFTNVSNLFYFKMTLYIFRMVFPSIIRFLRLYIQR